MPAAIPDRFKLEIRLGRDGDIEEWLGSDTSLDRPILIRSLGPESAADRRREFVESVSGAAKASHPHLARVFEVEEVEGGAYSVSEWTGGSTAEDRIMAHQPFELPDFLPNASGLAGALAALHAEGVSHGAIDLTAISYSVAHAAKLGAFGRRQVSDQRGDVRALAGALETALTGSPPGGPPPSERIDGLPKAIDRILRSGQSGSMSAADLEKALISAPTPRVPAPEPRATSRRLIFAALGLIVVAVGLVALGAVFSGGSAPIIPSPVTTSPAPATTTTIEPATTTPSGTVGIESVATFDPFGGGGENDDALALLTDGDITTSWQTERYQDPLASLKPGVGIALAASGTPATLEMFGLTVGTRFDLYWSDVFTADLEQWERIAGAQAPPGTTSIDLPSREGGFWLLWLTDLPQRADGTFYSSIAEVRFLP
jgi:hypothetical protein